MDSDFKTAVSSLEIEFPRRVGKRGKPRRAYEGLLCPRGHDLLKFRSNRTHKSGTKKGRTYSTCIECERLKAAHRKLLRGGNPPLDRQWTKGSGARRDPARKAETDRLWRLRKLGLTPGDVAALMEKQDGACGICKQPLTTAKILGPGLNRILSNNSAVIDQCHITGNVRGLLCNHCNRGLGFFMDDADRLRKAIAYLEGAP